MYSTNARNEIILIFRLITVYLLGGFDVEAEGLEHQWKVDRVAEGYIVQYNLSPLWPGW